jgi:hypothetical protein
MPISLSEKLVVKCYYRADNHECVDGRLYNSKELSPEEVPPAVRARVEEMQTTPPTAVIYRQPLLLENLPLTCPACEGKGVIPTEQGRELMAFFQTFLRPMIYEICSDYIDDKLGTS